MNVFDIIGPVMVGPSSSHTAGAVRIGRIARFLLNEEPLNVRIVFHGSFAKTYKGHGTDRAILAGLLGMLPDDRRIKDSLTFANNMGMSYSFATADLGDVHPNTVLISLKGKSGRELEILGSSIGGGRIIINKINGLEVNFRGEGHTLVVFHNDMPGAVAAVTHILARGCINIAQMKISRSCRGGKAIMIIETDQLIDNELMMSIRSINCVTFAVVVPSE